MKQPLPNQLNQTPPYAPMGYQTGYDQGHGYQTEPDKPVYVPQQNVINGIGSGPTADSPVGPGSNGSDSRDDKRIPIDESAEAPLIPERYLDVSCVTKLITHDGKCRSPLSGYAEVTLLYSAASVVTTMWLPTSTVILIIYNLHLIGIIF